VTRARQLHGRGFERAGGSYTSTPRHGLILGALIGACLILAGATVAVWTLPMGAALAVWATALGGLVAAGIWAAAMLYRASTRQLERWGDEG